MLRPGAPTVRGARGDFRVPTHRNCAGGYWGLFREDRVRRGAGRGFGAPGSSLQATPNSLSSILVGCASRVLFLCHLAMTTRPWAMSDRATMTRDAFMLFSSESSPDLSERIGAPSQTASPTGRLYASISSFIGGALTLISLTRTSACWRGIWALSSRRSRAELRSRLFSRRDCSRRHSLS